MSSTQFALPETADSQQKPDDDTGIALPAQDGPGQQLSKNQQKKLAKKER